jgi:uncharacterized protein YecT (DUF1311 family)
MKATTSLVLALLTCGVCWAQSGHTGSVGVISGVTITFKSKLEPPTPDSGFSGPSGIRILGTGKPEGMIRYLANNKTHEYFGYDMKVEPVDEHAGTYRVIFGPLTLRAEQLNLPDPQNWHMLPAPAFPAPQTITTADTIALDLFENPSTGQKIVDYLRLKRDNCDAESAGPGQVSCLNGLVQEAQRLLEEKMTQMEKTRDTGTAAAIRGSQGAWEKYRDAACGNLGTEVSRLQCELKLMRSRTHDLGVIYRGE